MMFCAMFSWHLPIGFREKDFKILSMYFRYFVIISRYMAEILRRKTISPWEKCGPSFEQIWIPLSQVSFVSNLVEIGQMVLEDKDKIF